ncbi:MAG: beta-glucanase (GH16 family) [Limisphaerales bacterium]|jgi:beta-glucanase (GH16 family)
MKKNLLILVCLISLGIFSCGDDGGDGPSVLPKMSISDVTFFEGDEGEGSFDFKVTLTAASEETVSASYTLQGDDAEAGSDFSSVTIGTVSFAPSETSVTLSIEIIRDTLREGDETFKVLLSNPVGAVLEKEEGIGTIRNDDTFILIDATGYTTPTTYPGLTMVWSDEFGGSTVNSANWTYEIGDGCPGLCGWGNNELEYYTNSSKNSFQTQGVLVIEAREENQGNSNYTSARMISRDKQTFKYGRIDMRAKLPVDRGLWPALWLLPQENIFGGWPFSGEIDIVELVGQAPATVHGTVHFQGAGGHQFVGNSYTISPDNFSDEFHVFSIDWQEDEIKFYVDDNLYNTITPSSLGTANYPYNEEFFFIMNVAVGGEWPGPPPAETDFPQRMFVDYVRVFQ